MLAILTKTLILVLFSFVIITFYYQFPEHKENFDGYLSFIFLIWIFYWIYKYFKSYFWGDKLKYSLLELIWYFLIILFIICYLFFSYNWLNWLDSIPLVIKIVLFTIIPFLILFISTWFGRFIIKKIGLYKENESIFSFLLSLWLWFFSFVSLVFIIGLIGFYNWYSVSLVLVILLAISYKENLELVKGFLDYRIKIENHKIDSNSPIEKIGLYLLSSEFLFIVASLIISINFLSIIRPMPIGWDDLWAYMNFPRQMTHSQDVAFLWGMYAWQIFTWIWYMISEPVQAFFMNNVWWVLSFIVIILVVSDLIKTNKRTFINIPLLLATIFISMPMVIFQQAKDMKLDEWLFFVTLIVIYLVYKVYFLEYFSKKQNTLDDVVHTESFFSNTKTGLKFLFVVWILAWFAFAIKITSLLLIVAIIAVLFFVNLGSFWFLGFLFLFISIFTKFNLWSHMNIDYPKENISLLSNFSLVTFVIALGFLIISIKRYTKFDLKKLAVWILVFIFWILVSLSPWIYKNISQVSDTAKINLSTILGWKQKRFVVDYSKIYPEDKLKKIQDYIKEKNKIARNDEDHLRYFGYEKGINNYVKLPWNLTMQVNQWGEFTTIWWLFLALLPGIFLFLPYRRKRFDVFPIILIAAEILLFIIPETRNYFTDILWNIDLPFGYIVILWLFLIPVLYFLYALKNTRLTVLFKINLIFTALYTFLWAISAYWIVWYGIMMYFGLLFMIWLWLYYLVSYNDWEKDNSTLIAKFFSSILVFAIISIWFFMSVFPHSFNNLKGAGYPNIKVWTYTPTELVFLYHSDYLPILFNLNIAKDKQVEFIEKSFTNKDLLNIAKPYLNNISLLNTFLNLLEKKQFSQVLWKEFSSQINSKVKNNLAKQAHLTKLNIYNWILKPEKQYQNTAWIYRIWTFLKYFISWNDHRLYEDSLLKNFDYYFNDKNPDIVVERMKKVWLKYLLVDLNAATIDRDPKHDLTRRYEDLLKTFTSNKLRLIETDSICLKLAREKYYYSKHTKQDLEKYINLAFVNSESYVDGKTISRWTKLLWCYKDIVDTINSKEVSKNKYSYLIPIVNQIMANPEYATDKVKLSSFLQKNVPAWSKVLFEIQ